MRKTYNSKAINDKYSVYKYLSKGTKFKKYLPDTVTFSKRNLNNMMNKYENVYVKPNVGSQGKGIYKITLEDERYILRSTRLREKDLELSALYQKLNARAKRKMIIQQGITLELVEGRPYDIRAMVQRKPNGNWNCTGVFTKVGKPNKIVTNYHQGGKLASLDKVFDKMNLSNDEKESRKKDLKDVALGVAKSLNSKRAGMFEMGIDFAYDREGNVWILEVNSNKPQFYPLKHLNRTMYNRMLSYARSYGRKGG
jgi:glutathione synthase/RimK-type ligase-like ATP-grasp enzyme